MFFTEYKMSSLLALKKIGVTYSKKYVAAYEL